jgi:formylmethanofuran dehydrogenase subunit B
VSRGREQPSNSAVTVEASAARLHAARRVLVTGFQGVGTDVVVAACDLAEAIGAAIDASDPEASRPAAPTIARVGEVTADRDELRDRADLVVVWFCDPEAACPGFMARHVTAPLAVPAARRTLAVGGPLPAAPPGTEHVALDRDAAIEAARLVQHMLVHGDPPSNAEPALAAACRTLHAAIDQATCVGFVTDDSSDSVGLESWSLVHLVRTIAHRKPAFEIPLRPRAAAFDAVCTWRYGAAGAIARADRDGGEFQPGEASAMQLIERGEVDAVVVVGGLPPQVERSVAAYRDGLTVIRLAGSDATIMADLGSLHAALTAATTGGAS